MRRTIALLMTAAAVVASFAAPAAAGKAKHVQGSFGATLAPFPNYSSNSGTARPGCSAGQEGVNWVGQEFTAPGKGNLRFYTEGFTGDWDIYVFQGDLVFGRGDQEQVGPALAPAEEEVIVPMTKGMKVTLVACNWIGDPNVMAYYEGHFK